MMVVWTQQILFSRIYENDQNIFYNQNYLVNDPLMVLIVRRIKNHSNENLNTHDVFNFYISSTYYSTTVQLGDEASTKVLTLDDGEIYYYIPENSYYSINNYGGYYISYPRNKESALSYQYLSDTQLMKPGWVNAMFMFVYMNRNSQMSVVNQISFDQYATGEIVGVYNADSYPEFYTNSLDYFR